MTKDKLRAWLARKPFIPFEIALDNGDHYVVHDSYAVGISDREAVLFNPQKEVVWFKLSKVTVLRRARAK